VNLYQNHNVVVAVVGDGEIPPHRVVGRLPEGFVQAQSVDVELPANLGWVEVYVYTRPNVTNTNTQTRLAYGAVWAS